MLIFQTIEKVKNFTFSKFSYVNKTLTDKCLKEKKHYIIQDCEHFL